LNKKLILYVAGYDGMVSAYEINTTEGGECSLNSQYLLFNIFLSTNSDQNAGVGIGQNAIGTYIHEKHILKSYFSFMIIGEPTKIYPPLLFKNDDKTT
jgi:hypothetical protein